MNKNEMALQYDKDENYLKAIEAYEEYFSDGDPAIEDYINLCALYFYITDFGVAAHLEIPPEKIVYAEKRFFELLNTAHIKFGKKTEFDFWEGYYKWRYWGEEFDQCRDLAKNGDSLIPYFFLLIGETNLDKIREYMPVCKILYEQVKDRSTTKKRIIASLLESAFLRIDKEEKKKQIAKNL